MTFSSICKLVSAAAFIIAGLVAFAVVTWTPWEGWGLFGVAAYVLSLVPVSVS